ncbi:LOW QUALITY PROTEIN: rho GTPase-activating protein 21 [Alosa alosa]|uniref:LOW QUALITY PROTEIN: rho GTPase-activating protein 21 n=1 Tax=Alosa alosa TaxID=278164 RepID=UPI0020153F7E|nr:LOW QUALITY PROTEIN: rho GTPase-activating protein 21 [Alosa alosa]
MMATHWMGPSDEDDDARLSARLPMGEDGAEQGDPMASLFQLEEESFSWPGPKTLHLRRTAQGFGFTLRHFIVYPPESAVHSSLQGEELGNRGRPRNRLEPMDTIFVKQVKEGGPAHGAGLCTGDRIVKVNGESIIGKTYTQVIALIQNSETFLELCVMPKDEDILQLAYSQDAYLKGHDPYSGNARHIPQPPPVCYPRVDSKPPSGMAQAAESSSSVGLPPEMGYRVEIPVPPSPPPPLPKAQTAVCVCSETGVRTVVVPPDGHLGHRSDYAMLGPEPVLIRPRPSTASGGRPSYPHPRKADLYPGYHGDPYGMQPVHFHPSASAGAHQNIDWRSYQTYREYIDNKGLHAYSRTIQERLDSLRSASPQSVHLGMPCGPPPPPPAPAWDSRLRRRSTSHERSYGGPPIRPPARSASQDRMSASERARHHPDWPPRSSSQDGLLLKARARSTDYVEHTDLVQPTVWLGDRRVYVRPEPQQRPSRQQLPPRAVLQRGPAGYGPNSSGRGRAQIGSRTDIPPPGIPAERPSRLVKNLTPEPGPKDQRMVGNHLSHAAHHLPQQQLRARPETLQSPETGRERDVGVVLRSSSCSSALPSPRPQHLGASAAALRPHLQEQPSPANGRGPPGGVVLREKPPVGKNGPQPLRHPSYILAVNEAEGGAREQTGAGAAGVAGVCWLPNDTRREMQMRRIGENESFSSTLDESLDSIPFIDEPASPSVDRDAVHIPASIVIAGPSATTAATPSPSTPSPLIRRQLSHDQESLKNAILESQNGTKTERSKSYDEGLDNYREEGRGRSSSKHMPSLKVFRKAVDGHKSPDDSGSRRDSSADVFGDSSKEGWLKLNTDKNKRVGGGIRGWKQMYSVLRGHSLYLYRDKKECLAHAHSQLDEVPQPICIKACLIDISYSETKRKNVLRLETSDGEYLFQAENRDDMLSWISVIRKTNNLDENAAVTSTDLLNRKISRAIKSVPGKSKSQSPHSPKYEDRKSSRGTLGAGWWRGITGLRRKPAEKKPTAGVTFGVRLDNCPPAQNNRFVPLIVEVCCKLVEERGLEYTGIYRVPGNNAAISSMQEELDTKGMGDIDIEEDKWRDLNVISSLLKSFFRKLPEPLFTNEKYADFIDANRTADAVERLKVLKRLIHELPDHHYETLKYLSGHLKMVSENCEKNKVGETSALTQWMQEVRAVLVCCEGCRVRAVLVCVVKDAGVRAVLDAGVRAVLVCVVKDAGVRAVLVCVVKDAGVRAVLVCVVKDAGVRAVLVCVVKDAGVRAVLVCVVKDAGVRAVLVCVVKDARVRAVLVCVVKDAGVRAVLDAGVRAVLVCVVKDAGVRAVLAFSWCSGFLCLLLLLCVCVCSFTVGRISGPPEVAFSHLCFFPLLSTDSASDSAKSKGSWGSGKDQYSRELLRSSIFASRKRKKPKDKPQPSSSDDDLDVLFPKKESQEQSAQPAWPQQPEEGPGDEDEEEEEDEGQGGRGGARGSGRRRRAARASPPPEAYPCPSPKPGSSPTLSYRMQAVRQCSLSDQVSSACDEGCTSDLGTLNSTSSQASVGRPGSSIMSPSHMVGAENSGRGPTLGRRHARRRRQRLVSEGRPMETDSESDLSVFAVSREETGPLAKRTGARRRSNRPLMWPSGSCLAITWRLIARRHAKQEDHRQKTDSESSASESGRGEREATRLAAARRARGPAGLGVPADNPVWRIKITDRLKFRLRSSADDMFGVGRSPETRAKRKGNIRRRHTMGGQRDFAELTVLGEPSPLSAVDRLKPKCSSQDFSIRDWIVRERHHRVSNPEVSLLGAASSSSSSQTLQGLAHDCPEADGGLTNGDGPSGQGKSLSLGADAHPQKLSNSQVVRSRFYQYL